ncbi:hypothetical protein F5X97DRAFT_324154 [Nemania serpens]|nr:hypothetical protein F5X97DRAFT_324154 [Nemania serpens]
MASPKPNTEEFDLNPGDSIDDGPEHEKRTAKDEVGDEPATMEPAPSGNVGKDEATAPRTSIKIRRSRYYRAISKLRKMTLPAMDTDVDFGDATGVQVGRESDVSKDKGKSIAGGTGSAVAELTGQIETVRRECILMVAATVAEKRQLMEVSNKKVEEVYSLAEMLRMALETIEPIQPSDPVQRAVLSATKELEKQAKEPVNAGLGAQPGAAESSEPVGGVSGYDGSDDTATKSLKRRLALVKRRRRRTRTTETKEQDGDEKQKWRSDPKNPENFLSTDSSESSD